MELIPKEHNIPKLYAAEESKDPICHIKLFTPDSSWSWYIIEMDAVEDICFGYVIGMEAELGYFSLKELSQVKGAFGLPVERDLYFTPTKLSEIKKVHS